MSRRKCNNFPVQYFFQWSSLKEFLTSKKCLKFFDVVSTIAYGVNLSLDSSDENRGLQAIFRYIFILKCAEVTYLTHAVYTNQQRVLRRWGL